MKKSRHFLMAVALLACHAGMAQITATFKPNAVQGQDVQLRSNESCPSWANTNYGTGIEINPSSWTYIGLGCGVGKYRSLLRFDALSSLPAGAVIQHAELRLYGVANSGHTPGNTSYPGSTFGTSNELWVRRVTGSWNEGTATWNNQPGFTTVDQVAVPASTSQWNHHVVLNVTSMVNAMMAPGSNHGFIVMLQNEAFYRSMLFASSDHPDATRWPELVVRYSLPNTATFKPNAVQGQDVQLRSNESCPSWANTNYGTGIEINPSAWTYSGLGCGVGKYRSLLRFDALSSLPAGAVIQHAELRLYGVASSGHTPGNTSYPGSTFGTSNELWVRRVTGSWNEGTATWNNQPGFTTVDQVAVPASTSRWNHHVVLNVTSMVNAMMAPGSNHGFIIMLQNEAFYRSMLFASSDHPDTTRWPELYVQYSLPTSTCTANIHFDFNSGVQGSYIFTGISNFWVPVTSVLWQFGDGKQSSQWPVVSHTYNAAGKYRVCLRINYANGCSAFNCIDLVVLMDRFVAFKVAGQSDAANSQPTLFPNPVVGDVVNVLRSSPGSTNVQYRVVDVTGRVLMTGKLLIGPGKQAVPVKLPGLRPGMYTIELTGWEKPYRVNFIKK